MEDTVEVEGIILIIINGISFIVLVVLFTFLLLEKKKVKQSIDQELMYLKGEINVNFEHINKKIEVIETELRKIEQSITAATQSLSIKTEQFNKNLSQVNENLHKIEKLLREPIDIEEWINESGR